MILEATYWLNSLTQGFIYIFCWNQLFPHRVKHTYLIGALNIPTLNILIMFCYRRAWLSYLALNILKMFSSIPALFILYKGSVRKKIWIFIATELISLLCTLPLEALLSFLYHAPIDQIVANKNDTIGGTILLNSILMGIGIIVGLLYNRKKTCFKHTIHTITDHAVLCDCAFCILMRTIYQSRCVAAGFKLLGAFCIPNHAVYCNIYPVCYHSA